MRTSETINRILILRAMERQGLPSHYLGTIGTKYSIDLGNGYTILVEKSINPIALEKIIKRNK